VHFKTIVPPADVDVLLIAPKGPGHLVRSEFEGAAGGPCPVSLAVYQNPTGNAPRQSALGLGALGHRGERRSGHHRKPPSRDECETDLFGEQAVPLRRTLRPHQGRL